MNLKFLDKTCQICFNSGKQFFVDSICGHFICFNCLCWYLVDHSEDEYYDENKDFDGFVDVVDKKLLWCCNLYDRQEYLMGRIKQNNNKKKEIMKTKCPFCRMDNWYYVLTDQILEDYQQMI